MHIRFCLFLARHTLEVACLLQDDSARIIEPIKGETILSIPPQLASQSVISCALSEKSQTIYILLSNSTVHVWQPVPLSTSAQLVAIWTEHRRARLVTLSTLAQAAVPTPQLRSWGMSSLDQSDEFLLAGTSDGDVWIMDRHAHGTQTSGCICHCSPSNRCVLSRKAGSQLISFCAHKLCPIQQMIGDDKEQRILTVAGACPPSMHLNT